nr:BRO family protein [Halocella sp. SP3-1]
MLNIKTENWNGHKIRFVWNSGEWWAVAKDVAGVLDYRMASDMTRMLDEEEKGTHKVSTPGGKQDMTIISETGIYEAAWSSKKPEAKEFKRWIKGIIKELRQATGLKGFEIFLMFDKEHQKEAMDKLKRGLNRPKKISYIKANTIANKAISNMYGYSKMVKKDDMSPEMLVKRQDVLDDTVKLIEINDKFNLDISVSEKIYNKYH